MGVRVPWKQLWLSFFRLSSFRIGVLAVAASVVLYIGSDRVPHLTTFIRSLDYRLFDAMFRLRGSTGHSDEVVIVDIDEKSLRSLGQWPWPRSAVADLIRGIGAHGPRVIGLDIVFAEPDRTSPSRFEHLFEEWAGTDIAVPDDVADNDDILCDALWDVPTVAGYYFIMQDDGFDDDTVMPVPEFIIPVSAHEQMLAHSRIPIAHRALITIPSISEGAISEGFFNAIPEMDGVVRKGTLFIRYKEMLYPSLPMEMLREGLGAAPKLVTYGYGINAVRFGEGTVPVTLQGQMWLNHRGGARTFPYVSAIDVIEGRIPEEILDGKYVLVGTSAAGLLDLRATPFAEVFPGVEINATIIDNILAYDAFRHNTILEYWLALGIVLVGGALLSAILSWLGPRTGAVAGAVLLLAVAAGNYLVFFSTHRFVGVVFPLALLLVIFLVVTVANYFLEGRQKRFIRGAFMHYVSDNVVHELERNPDKLALRGEQKVLTVMFSDIRGFTSISETMSAEELSGFLNEYLTAMTDIVIAHGGTVDKFIGDAIVAVWGAPLDDPEHAVHAVQTGLEMMERLRELRVDWERRGLPHIDIGVGINTGLISVGNMGSRDRFDYTVIGDNVNLASRLEGLNKLYGTHILVSEATYEIVADRVAARRVDLVRVKGKTQPVLILEPVGRLPVAADVQASSEAMDQAVAAYRARRFDDAEAILRRLNDAYPEPLYDLYLKRIESFRETPPGPGWDGVFTATTKGHDDE